MLTLLLRGAIVSFAGVGCAASTAYALADDAGRDGAARAARLYLTAGPAVAHYRYVEQKQNHKALETLHRLFVDLEPRKEHVPLLYQYGRI